MEEDENSDMTKSVLITGCSSGIGLTLAKGLTARGWQVFASARRPEDVAQLVAAGFTGLLLDLRDSASIRAALAEVLERTGGTLDALCNNAGYGQPGAVEDLSREVLREQFETNLFGTHELTTLVLPVMRRQCYGRIVYISSLLGYVTLPYRGAYNASKYALEGLIDTLRLELRGSCIYVSLIEPGPIRSRFRANAYAAFQRNIDAIGSVHAAQYVAMKRRFTAEGPVSIFTRGPEAVRAKVVHALESPQPQIRYPVTFPAYLFAALRRLLPGRALDRILWEIGEAERR
ncbi:Uncharacterized oxidoreductase YbbO [Gammaproteobacteria bacterium]